MGLTDYLRNEHSATLLLEALVWAGPPSCPHCRSGKVGRLGGQSSGMWKCYACRRKFCVRSVGPFRNSHVKTVTLLKMIYILSSFENIKSVDVADLLGVSERTICKIKKDMKANIAEIRKQNQYNENKQEFNQALELEIKGVDYGDACARSENEYNRFMKILEGKDSRRCDDSFIDYINFIKSRFDVHLEEFEFGQLVFPFDEIRT